MRFYKTSIPYLSQQILFRSHKFLEQNGREAYDRRMLQSFVIHLNNALTRMRRIQVLPENLLLLVPRCLQNSDCPLNLGKDLERCQQCGQCDITPVIQIRNQYGIVCAMAAGGWLRSIWLVICSTSRRICS